MPAAALQAQARRVQEALKAVGVATTVMTFPESTRTAQEAAAAIGVEVGQIVKSLVFEMGGSPLLALVSGANRVDTVTLQRVLGAVSAIGKADAEMVRRVTGFSIGGVPPLAHASAIEVVMDEDLLAFETVYAAAGTPNSVFAITPAELVRVSGARVAAIRAPASPA